MKDQFYVILPSNSSMQFYPNNTTTKFTTYLAKNLELQGDWLVALTEIQIPLTFQHINSHHPDRYVQVQHEYIDQTENDERPTTSISYVTPGIYKDVEIFVDEINELSCMKNHFSLILSRGGRATIKRTCEESEVCKNIHHTLTMAPALKKILGFPVETGDQNLAVVNSDQPAQLSNNIPDMFMIYSDIIEPYAVGDVQAKLLRSVPLNHHQCAYNTIFVKTFSSPIYIPVLTNTFRTIDIDIRDQFGESIPFDRGTLTVTLHFKRSE